MAHLGCDKKADTPDTSTQDSSTTTSSKAAPTVVVTTTMLASAAQKIGGEDVVIRSIMKPGGDPHLHQPTPSDAKMVSKSDLVITSGLYLEGWLDDLVKNAGGERSVVVASDGVTPISMEGSPGGVDPHFWFDLKAWGKASTNVTDALVSTVGKDTPEGKAIAKRGEDYAKRIAALDAWSAKQLETIPKAQRILITSHDAFNYFGRAYDIEVVGIQGSSTEQAASQRDVVNIIEKVKANNVPTIFIESSVNPALIKQVASQTGVKTAGPLFSDSLGMPDSKAPDYEGMVVENVTQIVNGLGGKVTPFDAATP